MITIDILRKPTDEEWARCYALAVGTEGKETVKVPSESWKHRILLAEHSPIRTLVWTIRLHGVPYYVSNHLVRHKYGGGMVRAIPAKRPSKQLRPQQGPAGRAGDGHL